MSRVFQVPTEVTVVGPHSMYSTTHKFTAFYDAAALGAGHFVPFNVFCNRCEQMCAIDMAQGFTLFWCLGEFKHASGFGPPITRRCEFTIRYPTK